MSQKEYCAEHWAHFTVHFLRPFECWLPCRQLSFHLCILPSLSQPWAATVCQPVCLTAGTETCPPGEKSGSDGPFTSLRFPLPWDLGPRVLIAFVALHCFKTAGISCVFVFCFLFYFIQPSYLFSAGDLGLIPLLFLN